MTYEERRKLTESQIKEMSRKELDSLALDYWSTLMAQQQILKNIALVGDEYSKAMAKGVLNGTLDVVFDEDKPIQVEQTMSFTQWYDANYDVEWDVKCAEAYGTALRITMDYEKWCELNNTHPIYSY